MEPMTEKKRPGQAMVALRNKKLSAQERKEIASKAAKARWSGRPSYTLRQLLAQCNPKAPWSAEEREWLDAKPAGRELI